MEKAGPFSGHTSVAGVAMAGLAMGLSRAVTTCSCGLSLSLSFLLQEKQFFFLSSSKQAPWHINISATVLQLCKRAAGKQTLL